MNKKRTSLKALILVPVFILGILSVLSNKKGKSECFTYCR